MSGLGGLEQIAERRGRSAWCSCSCRWSRPPAQLRGADRSASARWSARRGATTPALDLVVFPEYALHGLSMSTDAPS